MLNSPGYDIFISYAHVDNESGWVTQFVGKLIAAIAIRSGGRSPRIFFDQRRVQANSVLEDMLSAARSSKIFLVIGSRAYVSSERFTLKELAAFTESVSDKSRIFVISTLPLRTSQSWPASLANKTAKPFFFYDDFSGQIADDELTATTLSLDAEPVRFLREVNRLAEEIVKKLEDLSASASAHGSTKESPAPAIALDPAFERKRVLIAQPTDSLEDEAAELREYLARFGDGLQILPHAPYPQGGSEFRAAFLLDLDRADMVVNLLDRRPGRCPPDLAEGYTMFQLNAAREHGVALMQWRDPRIDLSEIASSEYREVLNGPDVIACGFNEFKETVRKAAVKPVAKDRPANGSIVYVHASPNDKDVALRIGENCGRYKLFCHLPQFEQRTINTRAVQERLSTSNAVLFIYCNADTRWAQREAETIYKYSRRDGDQMIALCFGPPEKSDMFVFPDARIIRGSSESELFEKIDSLLRELAA